VQDRKQVHQESSSEKLSIERSKSTTGSNFGAVNLQSIKEQGHIFKDKTSWYSTQESTS